MDAELKINLLSELRRASTALFLASGLLHSAGYIDKAIEAGGASEIADNWIENIAKEPAE